MTRWAAIGVSGLLVWLWLRWDPKPEPLTEEEVLHRALSRDEPPPGVSVHEYLGLE